MTVPRSGVHAVGPALRINCNVLILKGFYPLQVLEMKKHPVGFMIQINQNVQHFCILVLVEMPTDLQPKNNVIENVDNFVIKMFVIWIKILVPVLEDFKNGMY